MHLKVFLAGGLLALALAAGARAEQPEGLPGAVDFSALGLFNEDDLKVDITIKGTLLSLLVEATKQEDHEFSDLVAKLDGIDVKVFRIGEGKLETVTSRLNTFGKDLEKQGWERVVRVRDNGEHVDTYLRTADKHITGLVVTVVDPKDGDDGSEAVLVNILGDIDPAQIGRIGHKFHIRPLEGLGGGDDEERHRVEVGIHIDSKDDDKDKEKDKEKFKEKTKEKDKEEYKEKEKFKEKSSTTDEKSSDGNEPTPDEEPKN
jgi:uncharacterized protein DUF4252